MKVSKNKNTYYMDSRFFAAKGHNFEIIGTRIEESGTAYCDVVNRTTGSKSEIEHQTLCKLILKYEKA